MKKIVSLALSAMLATSVVAGFASCGGNEGNDEFKVGFICLHDESSTYDLNFINAAKAATKALGLKDSQVVIKTNIPEGDECYEAAADLADGGCDVIFADSFGHEPYLIEAAKEFPDVEFCHSTGTMAHTEGLKNYHNAFASIYEGRYLAGVAAGLKLNELKETKMGYVGAFPYAEVVSGYTAFYLGAKSVCPEVTMTVRYTNSWYDLTKEEETALTLIETDGCKLISQHADSLGAPTACERKNVPNVSYNGDTSATGVNTYIISSRINWQPYYEFVMKAVRDDKKSEIPADWTGTLANGSVEIYAASKNAAEGTQTKLDEVKAKLIAGEINVFDTANFTVKGEKLTSYKADVDTDKDYTPDTEVIENGVFKESKFRSAPYFDVRIDGITEIIISAN